MKISQPIRAPMRLLYSLVMKGRRVLPKQRCEAFGKSNENGIQKIGKVYVINLDRQTDRWYEMVQELKHVKDAAGEELINITERFSAIDARSFAKPPSSNDDVNLFYTLRDQLYVEPQPNTLPDRFELDRRISMSWPEISVAHSHIEVWRRIAAGDQLCCLVLEDDIWFRPGFARYLDQAWMELGVDINGEVPFDILYLSYEEARHGAPKTFLSSSVFRPARGLWHLAGYVLSREGALKLLGLLPCRGPVDLWINHQFDLLNVLATSRSIISQRWDGGSTNSYSVLPALTKIGVIDSEGASLFQARPPEGPVFAFGPEDSGLSSLAMALSMLGYRCCSDLCELPESEFECLLSGSENRIFDAYVNIGTLTTRVPQLRERYPSAKFIFSSKHGGFSEMSQLDIDANSDIDFAVLQPDSTSKWTIICEHLRCVPPFSSYPVVTDLGQRELLLANSGSELLHGHRTPKRDPSPWIIESQQGWQGIHCASQKKSLFSDVAHIKVEDSFLELDSRRWFLRDDTFAGNLALFRPSNIEFRAGNGLALIVKVEHLGVRDYSAAAISSHEQYLFGRFEAVFQASSVPGVVTGFFLHRDSPRQEIDIEIVGGRPEKLLVNVFYNPGDEGAKFDYGYRGAPSCVELGFDASKSAHRFAIEWGPDEITWLVDGQPVHRRVNWDPTPIPHLPMTLHINAWPSRSRELAGRLSDQQLPSTSVVRSVLVDATLRKTGSERNIL